VLALACVALLIHGELRSPELLRAVGVVLAALVGSLLLFVGVRRWLLRRALLAERPRAPDEWSPGEPEQRRLWEGALRATAPVPAAEHCGPSLYRRTEVERWEGGRWRRVAVEEHYADELSLCGRRRTLLLSVPRASLRKAAVVLGPARLSPSGWRADPDPDPSLLYRERVLAVLDGARVRVLAVASRGAQGAATLRGVATAPVLFDEARTQSLGREAGLCAAAALVTTALGLWGAWP
jgi:hypothetical protein